MDNIKVFNPITTEPVAYIAVMSSYPWITVRCQDQRTKIKMFNSLTSRFVLTCIEHKTHRLSSTYLPSQYYITVTTGNGPKGYIEQFIGSYFELKYDFGIEGRNKKVIGKALCAYSNCDIDVCGPTIESLEIAEEWRDLGLGSAFLKEIEKFFQNQFDSLNSANDTVTFSGCNIKSSSVTRWYQSKGFISELFGEYVSKPLYDEDPDHDSDDEMFF